MKIAIVGGGIAGLGAAWLLSRENEITVFEANDYPGGHSNTVEIEASGRRVPVDTGFIVYNELNYPNLTRLFEALGVPTEASNMSFAVSISDGDFEYEGSLPGLVAQPSNLARPRYMRMIRDVLRFYREAPELLEAGADGDMSLGAYLRQRRYSDGFIRDHLLPMGAAIWSASLSDVLEFPAASFVRFLVNHGLLRLMGRPQWRTVSGGSREYVRRLVQPYADRLRLNTAIAAVRRGPDGVWLRDVHGRSERFDQLVLATHADQALALLGEDADSGERRILGEFRYTANRAVLHTDQRLMPRRRSLWASWNYLADDVVDEGRKVAVTYWMNRLQNLETAPPLFVTLNPLAEPDPAAVHREFVYDHPQFDARAVQAQRQIWEIQGARRTWFCGSYCGYGFHEDGLQAGFAVAEALGAPAPWAREITPASPAIDAVALAPVAVAAE